MYTYFYHGNCGRYYPPYTFWLVYLKLQINFWTIPPTNALQWNEAFDLYKQYPEYQKLNYNMTIDEFKDIYFWEWIHRVIGRFIGLVFVIPFVYFLLRKQLKKSTIKKCLILLFMGGFQGFLGWFMVKSGLVDKPDVSHYRLAMHLTTAFLTFAILFGWP